MKTQTHTPNSAISNTMRGYKETRNNGKGPAPHRERDAGVPEVQARLEAMSDFHESITDAMRRGRGPSIPPRRLT
jgi:hypothetical protein